MESMISRYRQYKLSLSEEEAKYLRELTRNYLGDGTEADLDRRIRKDLFDAVQEEE